jgi:hypothetical protein
MGKHRHKHKRHKPRRKKGFKFWAKKFLFWFVIYSLLIILFDMLLSGTKIYQAGAGYYIVMGFILIISSRLIYSAYHKKKFRLNGVVIWGLLYVLDFALVTFLLGKFPSIAFNSGLDKYLNILLFAAIFTIILMFLRRMKIGKMGIGRKKPSQIFTGIILLVAGIVTLRFSHTIFVGWFNWIEGMAWSWLIGWGLILAGFLVLVAWWRNNVSMFTTRHRVKWN